MANGRSLQQVRSPRSKADGANAMSELTHFTTEDGRSQIKLRAKDQTVWLSQREMANPFDVSADNVGLHLNNVFEDGQLSREATTEKSSVVQNRGRPPGAALL